MLYIDPSWSWFKRWYYNVVVTLFLLAVCVAGIMDSVIQKIKGKK